MDDHITAAEYQHYLKTGKLPERIQMAEAKNKYGNIRASHGGKEYPSKHECNRAAELIMMARAGEVIRVFEQVPFILPGGIVYKADFVILWPDRTWTVEDAKGVRTKEYILKKKLFREKYGFDIEEV